MKTNKDAIRKYDEKYTGELNYLENRNSHSIDIHTFLMKIITIFWNKSSEENSQTIKTVNTSLPAA